MSKVYSYARFSDPKQAGNTSLERQAKYAEAYASKNNMQLDLELSLRDEGLSAFHQKHVSKGALGVFLKAVEDGKITPGSVLVVEAHDRLSRAEPLEALDQFRQIINAGVSIATARDDQTYSKESLSENSMSLLTTVMQMIQAHEYSKNLSKRVVGSIDARCVAWLKGDYKGKIRQGRTPGWINETEDGFALDEENANAMRQVIHYFKAGYGAAGIEKKLNEAGIPYQGVFTNRSHIYKVLKNPILYGMKIVTTTNKTYSLKHYYPALISESEFEALEEYTMTRSKTKPPRSGVVGFVAGMGITHCGYCGHSMSGVNYLNRAKDGDKLKDGHRRLLCSNHNLNNACPVGVSCSIVPIEQALIKYCSDQLNIQQFMQTSTQAQALTAQIDALKKEVIRHKAKVEKLTSVLVDDDDGDLDIIHEAILSNSRAAKSKGLQIKSLEGNRGLLTAQNEIELAQRWSSVSSRSTDHRNTKEREEIRALVLATIKRLVVFTAGALPEADRSLLLHFNSGISRLININKKGEIIGVVENYGEELHGNS